MNYQIDKDVPLPPTTGVGRKLKYPFDKLQPGDSFIATVNAVRYAAYGYGKRHGLVFSVSKKSENEYRCWRRS